MKKNKLISHMALATVAALMLQIAGCSNSAASEPPVPTVIPNATTATDTPAPAEPTKAPEEELVAIQTDANYDGIATRGNAEKVGVHDPSLKVFNGKYYIYGSHMTAAVSDNLWGWSYLPSANRYDGKNSVYGKIFQSVAAYKYAGLGTSIVPTDDGGNHVWAPDVIYNKKMGKYCMYLSFSSTWNASNLALAVSDSPEGPFEYKASFVYSGLTEKTTPATDVYAYVDEAFVKAHYWKADGTYNYNEYPNAIDPGVFYDANGKLWMVYGSWSGGIFILELDEATGLPIHPEYDEANHVDPYFGKKLIGGFHKSIEGPYIHYVPETGYYYLYVAYGGLNQKGGYQVRVFRSENPDGPYVDMNDKYPFNTGHTNYGLKLSGNYYLPSLKEAYMATGHQSALTDTDGKMYLCYHTRFENQGELHQPCTKQILMNEEGWPCLTPYKTSGETMSTTGYDTSELVGDYYFINQGTAIDSIIARPVMITLRPDGKVSGTYIGTWEAKAGTPYVHMTLTIKGKEKTYSGVFCKQNDMSGVETMTFSAVGQNESIWGVMYPQK